MKKILLITIFLLLQSFPSFGNPNGKGLICKCINNCSLKTEQNYKSIYFNQYYSGPNNIFTLTNYRTRNDIVYESGSVGIFEKDYDKIFLYVEFNNKKTLEYTILRKDLTMKYNLKKVQYKCDVFKQIEFRKRNKLLKIFLQNEYNKKLKDNKI